MKTFKESIEIWNHCKNIKVPDFACHHENFLEYVQDQIDVYNELQHLRNTRVIDTPWEPQVTMLLTYTSMDMGGGDTFPAFTKIFERYKKPEDN